MFTFILYSILLILPSFVFAHHPLNGGLMETFNDGLLSGIGHPILGLDHLIFIIGVGLISFISRKFINFSFAFIGGTFLGLFSIIFGLYLPFYEIIISCSLLLLGYLILKGKNPAFKGFLFIFFGVFHGWAYGAIMLDRPEINLSVILGYSIGLFLTQLLIVFLGFQFFKYLTQLKSNNFGITPIFSGVMIGIASVNLFEIFEAFILNSLN